MTTRTISFGVAAFLLGALLIVPAAYAQEIDSCGDLADAGLDTGICAQADEKLAYAVFLCAAAIEGAEDLDRCQKACRTAEKRCNSQMNSIRRCSNDALNGTITTLKKGKQIDNKTLNACKKDNKTSGSDVKEDQNTFCAPVFNNNCGCSIACTSGSCDIGDDVEGLCGDEL